VPLFDHSRNYAQRACTQDYPVLPGRPHTYGNRVFERVRKAGCKRRLQADGKKKAVFDELVKRLKILSE